MQRNALFCVVPILTNFIIVDLHLGQSLKIDGLTTSLSNKQDSDADLTAIAGLSPSNDDFIQRILWWKKSFLMYW